MLNKCKDAEFGLKVGQLVQNLPFDEGKRAKYLSRNEVFADEIAEVLQGAIRREYLEKISRKDRRQLNDGLRGAKRWRNLGQEKTRADFMENDLDHVKLLLSWCREIGEKYPNLREEVTDGKEENWDNLLIMLIVHDIGEIATGDICRSHPDFHSRLGKVHKRKEAFAAWKMLGRLNDSELSARLRNLYRRFDKRDSSDKLVNLGHFLDKAQSTATLAREIIPFNAAEQNYTAERLYERETGGLEYAERLATQLKKDIARKELAELIEEKVLCHYDRLEIAVIADVQSAVRKRVRESIMGESESDFVR